MIHKNEKSFLEFLMSHRETPILNLRVWMFVRLFTRKRPPKKGLAGDIMALIMVEG